MTAEDTANLAMAWEALADAYGDRPALMHCTFGAAAESAEPTVSTVTWSAFDDRAARLAAGFAAAGLGPGDNVACAMFNCSEYLETEFAAFKLRAAPFNVNYRYVEGELRYLVDNANAGVVVFDQALAERFDAVRGDLDNVRLWVHVGPQDECPEWATSYESIISANDPAPRIDRHADDLWILYTGGTTGNPKGVMWPHRSLVGLLSRSLEPMGLPLPDTAEKAVQLSGLLEGAGALPRQLAAAPLMHGTSGIGALFTLVQGGAVVTVGGRSFEADELWRAVEATETTTISIVGDVFCRPMVEGLDARQAAGRPVDLSSLQGVTSSGVMWSQPVKEALMAHGTAQGIDLTLRDSLGASEGVGFGSQLSEGAADAETATFELGPNAAIFTEDGKRVLPGSGEVGFLAVTGPIPLGYYGDPEKTASTFPVFEGERWSVPGDFATIAADGTVTLLGRGSVSINTGGEKVFPEEVEEALKEHESVIDATVVGVPDPTWGSAVTAVVQFADGARPADEDLITALRTSLSGYKLPKHVVPVDQVFRGPNGKADYSWAGEVARAQLGLDPV